MQPGRVLIVAGSDSGGGAGIQADIKTVTMLGGYAATAITALTAQNTLGVHGVLPIDPAFVRQQMEVVLSDIGADCVKTGMLHNAAVVDAVADVLQGEGAGIPLVVDPVMIAETGAALLEDEAVSALRERLLPRATLITPNLPEAETLLGRKIPDIAAMPEAARELAEMAGGAVLLKGGHLAGEELVDILALEGEIHRFSGRRMRTRATHGTGCTLASAIATRLAAGRPLEEAVTQARKYLRQAMLNAPVLGRGAGPVNHAVRWENTTGGR